MAHILGEGQPRKGETQDTIPHRKKSHDKTATRHKKTKGTKPAGALRVANPHNLPR